MWPKMMHCTGHAQKNKARFGAIWQKAEGNSPPNFFVQYHTVILHLYLEFHPNQFRFGKIITEKPLRSRRK